MTTLDKLKKIIQKAVPEIKDYYRSGSYKLYDENFKEVDGAFDREIRLADALLAINQKEWGGVSIRPLTIWNLEKNNLDDQDQETLDFLYKLLK